MIMKSNNQSVLPSSVVLLALVFTILALAPQFLSVIFPGFVLLEKITTRPYWFVYLLFLAGIAIFIEIKLKRNRQKEKK